jgi:hypothetical protein
MTTTKSLGQSPNLMTLGAGLQKGLNAAEKQLVNAAVNTVTSALKLFTAELEQLTKSTTEAGHVEGSPTPSTPATPSAPGTPTTPSPSDSTHPAGSLKADANGVITTPGGYKIEATAQFNWKITGPDGKSTEVWGDPHVKESDGGTWDFKKDSTFLLGDGTRINVGVKPYGNGATVTSSLDIIAGNERLSVTDIDKGKGKTSAVSQDGYQHVNDFGGNDVFVMGKDSDDWSFFNKEIIGSSNQGEKLKFGDSIAPGTMTNPSAVPGLKTDEKTGVVTTPGGYQIEATEKFGWKITGPDGKSTEIWGDPHVKEADGGKWDFKRNSTFVLGDGTRINVGVKPYGNGATVTSSLDIFAGNNRVTISGIDQGKGRTGDMTVEGNLYINDFGKNDVYVMGKDTDDWSFKGHEVTGSQNQGETVTTGGELPAGSTPTTKPTTPPTTTPTTKPTTKPGSLGSKLEQLSQMFQSLSQLFSALKNLDTMLNKRTNQNPGIVPPGKGPVVTRRQTFLEQSFGKIGTMLDTVARFEKLNRSIETARSNRFMA